MKLTMALLLCLLATTAVVSWTIGNEHATIYAQIKPDLRAPALQPPPFEVMSGDIIVHSSAKSRWMVRCLDIDGETGVMQPNYDYKTFPFCAKPCTDQDDCEKVMEASK